MRNLCPHCDRDMTAIGDIDVGWCLRCESEFAMPRKRLFGTRPDRTKSACDHPMDALVGAEILRNRRTGAITGVRGNCRICFTRDVMRELPVAGGVVEERGQDLGEGLRDVDSGVVSHAPNGNASDMPHSTISDSENNPKGG